MIAHYSRIENENDRSERLRDGVHSALPLNLLLCQDNNGIGMPHSMQIEGRKKVSCGRLLLLVHAFKVI